MKKKYIVPNVEVLKVELTSHLMDLSNNGSYSISNTQSSTNAFVKGESSSSSPSRYNVWDDDWSAE